MEAEEATTGEVEGAAARVEMVAAATAAAEVAAESEKEAVAAVGTAAAMMVAERAKGTAGVAMVVEAMRERLNSRGHSLVLWWLMSPRRRRPVGQWAWQR